MTVERWTDEMLDKLADKVDRNAEQIDKNAIQIAENAAKIDKNAELIKENSEAIRQLREESKEQGIRFTFYQQASQWVVNLAFGLLATATITTIVSALVRK